VDSLVFDHLVEGRPEIREAVRVIARSPPFGAAPVVASTRLPPTRRAEIKRALLALQEDPVAAEALRTVGFERFATPPPRHFESAAAVVGASR
jgi:ABC-type phosphate/phosphonate transport system substrate-binding protein